MKKLNIFGIFVIALFGLLACSDDTDPQYETGTSVKPAAFTDPQDGKVYVLLEGTEANTFEKYTWTGPDYGIPVGVRYVVQLDTAGGDFSKAVVLATTTERSVRFTVKQINDAILSFGYTTTEPVKLQMRLQSNAMGGEEGTTALPDFPVVASEPINLTVTPFMTVINIVPLYIIGRAVGGWDNSSTEYMMFREDSDPTKQIYTYTGKFNQGEFKLISGNDIGTWNNLYGDGENGKLSQDGGASNISGITAEGYYTVTADIAAMTYSIVAISSPPVTYSIIGLIGEFNDWNGDAQMTVRTYDPHIWVIDNIDLPAGEVKFRANAGWDVNWGGENLPYGKGVNGGNNLKLEAGSYYIKFNDITGHYIFDKR